MKQYKLINNTTKEETICGLVTIDGFDYYISGTKQPSIDSELYHCSNKGKGIDVGNGIPEQVLTISKYTKDRNLCKDCKLVIATNNPNIDIPKVIDINIINTLAKNATEKQKFANGLHEKVVAEIYFRKGYNKAKETYQFTEENMIEFGNFCKCITKDNKDILRNNPNATTTDLLSIWEGQQLKVLYYE